MDLADINGRGAQSLSSNLGIEITELADAALHGRIPVDGRTARLAGVFHGGASVAFAEPLAFWAGYLAVDRTRFHVAGQEINANHIHPVSTGWVRCAASPVHVGGWVHVWEVRISSDASALGYIFWCTPARLSHG